MTNKEAKGNLMYALKWNDMPEKEALKIAIKALDNDDVLDKIRAEIEQIDVWALPKDERTAERVKMMVLEIVDKHISGKDGYMTREEAKQILSEIESQCCDASSIFNTLDWKQRIEALDMAIQALEQMNRIKAILDMWQSDKHTYYALDEIAKVVNK